ncbi:MAG: anthranilate phosphoribosyltransferase [Acidimicrobiia bacterium]|nr:anthranilate phosphoribosyltransferase [Acidimicrobiia bacterium]
MARPLDWADVLERLIAGDDLSHGDAAAAMASIMAGDATPAQIGGFLVALRSKGASHDELCGLLDAMLDAAEPLPVDGPLIDTCGTGGSPQRRVAAFNVSTAAALVAAGGGARVCKHGNRRATATSGSADTLEALGVVIDLGPAGVARCIEEAGMGFCFAPHFHPGMRHAGPVRRELRIRTVFNFLGPMANPARPTGQVVGVSDPSMASELARVLRANGAHRAMVVFGHDGLDELTTTTASTVVELDEGEIRSYDIQPAGLGLKPVDRADIRGGDARANATLVRAIVDGQPGPHRDIVVLNAGAALFVANVAHSLEEGVAAAGHAIDTGAAASTLDRLVAASRRAAGS